MLETEYEPVATSDDGTFNLEDADLDGGDHLLVVQATSEDGEVSAYSEETVYSQEYSKFAIQKATLTAIADSVRAKTGKTDLIPTLNLASEIDSIMDLDDFLAKLTQVTVYENGSYITGPDHYGYSSFNVEVPIPQPEEKTVTPTESTQIVEPSSDEYLLSKVTVEAIPDNYKTLDEFLGTIQQITIKENGTYVPESGCYGYDVVRVQVPTEVVTSAQMLPDLEWLLKETLDFSMIPENLLGSIHFIYFGLPDSDIDDGKPFIGLRISDSVVTAIQYDDFTTEVTLYDANGWVDPSYRTLHTYAAAVSNVFGDFIGGNYIEEISFTIDDISLQAERGMTWSEWIASSYNTGAFVAIGSNVTIENAPSDYIVCTSDGTAVVLTDEIISGHSYTV